MMKKTTYRTDTGNGRRYRVAVAIPLASIAGQRKIAGIFSTLRKISDWDIRIFRTQEEINRVFRGDFFADFDGVIYSGIYDRGVFAKFAQYPKPLVVMDQEPSELRKRTAPTVVIRNSAAEIVGAAKRYLADVGQFQSSAFIHERHSKDWSNARAAAFAETMPKPFSIFAPVNRNDKNDRTALGRFIAALAKPTMLLCANDRRATEVLSAIADTGFAVPDEVSVIGVDNDPYACTAAHPSISSIEPDHIREGEIAAERLDKLMRGNHPSERSERILVGVSSVFLRESTMKRPAAKNLLKEAAEYIVRNACEGLTPAKVAQALEVSRPLLDLRLREARQPSLARQIAEAQLAAAAKLLKSSDLIIDAIADRCGFKNRRSLENRFKARYGVTMSAYRG